MNKKIIFSLVTVIAVVAGVAGMAAYEAHVINVTAHIENALYVHPDEIAFGTVFPQEYVERDFTVQLSTSFEAATRVDDVEYVIKQKPKCICDSEEYTNEALCPEGKYAAVGYATHVCPDLYREMENLCQFLSKVDADPDDNNDTSHPSYYVEDASGDYCVTPVRIERTMNFQQGQPSGEPAGWAGWSCPTGTHVVGGGVIPEGADVYAQGPAKYGAPAIDGYNYPVYPHYTYNGGVNAPGGEEGWVVEAAGSNPPTSIYVDCLANNPDATGRLSKIEGDLLDLWKVDLKVPPVEGFVGQDWPAGCPTVPTNDVDYGCDLWIEVTGISPSVAVCGDGWITTPEQCESNADCGTGGVCTDCSCAS